MRPLLRHMIIALWFGTLGCVNKHVVVFSPIEGTPTFTAIPASIDKKDFAFAAEVEAGVIQSGNRLIERPAVIESMIETEGGAVGVGVTSDLSVGLAGGKGRGRVTRGVGDVTFLYDATSANIVFVVRKKGTWVKAVRRDTCEILYSGGVGGESTSAFVRELVFALRGADRSRFAVRRNTSGKSFTVLPASVSRKDQIMADKVVRSILAHGYTVKDRPPIESVTSVSSSSGIGAATDGQSAVVAAGGGKQTTCRPRRNDVWCS